MPGKSVIDDGIHWERMGREAFEQLVEALLSRVHDRDGHEIVFPDGKGGDGGRDAVAVADGRTIVYQLKYFPDGLSTSGSSRKRQVQRSFKAALAHDPDQWVLVVPCKLTDAFRRLVKELPKGTRVKVAVWDRPKVDSMLAERPDLVALLKQDDLLTERARLLGAGALLFERGILDAVAHRQATQAALNEMHPHWGVLVSEPDGIPTFEVVAKTKHSARLSPLGVKVEVQFNASDPLGVRVGEVERFGRPGVTIIPKDRITSFVPYGLEWAGIRPGDPLPDRLELHVPSVDTIPGRQVALRAHDAQGRPVGSFTGTATGGNRGSNGMTLDLRFFGCVNVSLLMPQPGRETDDGPRLSAAYTWPGDPATTARGTAVLLAFFEAASFDIHIDGEELATFRLGNQYASSDAERLRKVHEFASDLAAVQQHTDTFFDIPEQISDLDRVWLRCIRLMLDGHAVLIPQDRFTGTPNAAAETDAAFPGDGLGAIVADIGQTLELCGQRIPIPMVRAYHPMVQLNGVREAFADVRSAIPAGLKFTMTATGNDAFLGFMPDRYRGDTVTASPWKLSGVSEPEPLPVTGYQPPVT